MKQHFFFLLAQFFLMLPVAVDAQNHHQQPIALSHSQRNSLHLWLPIHFDEKGTPVVSWTEHWLND